MINCDCNERIGIKINSLKQFEEMKVFFDEQVAKGCFIEVPVDKPYHVGQNIKGEIMRWYANKWYKCLVCGVIWEFIYPNFPAQGTIRKIIKNDYEEGT